AATVAVAIAAGGAGVGQAGGRSASVHDDSPGGAAALRRYLEAMGAQTVVAEGDVFAIPSGAGVLFILGVNETVSAEDVTLVKNFVDRGGVLIVATDIGFFERPILEQLGVHTGGVALSGLHPLTNAAFAEPPARSIAVDRGVTFTPDRGRVILATDGKGPLVVSGRIGSGLFHVVGSLAPFLTGNLGIAADPARGAAASLEPRIHPRLRRPRPSRQTRRDRPATTEKRSAARARAGPRSRFRPALRARRERGRRGRSRTSRGSTSDRCRAVASLARRPSPPYRPADRTSRRGADRMTAREVAER